MSNSEEIIMRKVFFKTFGCQMNMYDSQFIQSILAERGIETVKKADQADIIIINGCSIRKHAEDRAVNWIHQFARLEGKQIVVIGCLAQRMGDDLRKKVNGIDIICGPDNYMKLIDMISEPVSGITLHSRDHEITYSLAGKYRPDKFSGFVSITRGCENFCSYCVVPYLRGSLRSKKPETVIREINMLSDRGLREITLLGQNVLAYRWDRMGFTGLLERILGETGIERIRFLTSHPRDVEIGLFRIMKENRRVCPHIHLPLQAGSDRILKLMRRGYTSEEYLSLLERARDIVPDLAVSTDIIVGFPSEKEEDFRRTMEAVRRARFDSAFTFKYSPREGTTAWNLPDDLEIKTKKERLSRLNSLVREIRRDILEGVVGKSFKILLDGTVQRGENHYVKGRTPHFRNVLVSCEGAEEGEIMDVTLERLDNFTFTGKCRR